MNGYERWLIQPLPSFPIPTYIMGDLQETWRGKVTFPYVKDGHLGLDQLGLDPGLPDLKFFDLSTTGLLLTSSSFLRIWKVSLKKCLMYKRQFIYKFVLFFFVLLSF